MPAKKTAEYREMAREKGVPNWETLERAELIKALKVEGDESDAPSEVTSTVTVAPEVPLEAPPEVPLGFPPEVPPFNPAEERKVEETPSADVSQAGLKEGHIPVGSKAEIMKAALAVQPKVRILIPLMPDEKFGVTESVILNGYRLNITKGVYVDVPEQVANVIMAKMEAERQVLAHPLRVDESNRQLQ